MAPLPKPSGNNAQSSGTSTPPPTEMGTLVEEEQLVVGALYWIEDERGDDVWASAEVLDHCEGHVMVQMTDSGERKEIDLVSSSQSFLCSMKNIFLKSCANFAQSSVHA